MNYSAVLDALNTASLFDLYRLREAIQKQLEDPARLDAIKCQCRVGQRITWFDSAENRLVEAEILALKQTRASVRNLADGKRWTIPLFFINLQGVSVDITPSRAGVDRNTLKVGDLVGFQDRQGHERYGKVIKLNRKTAGIAVGNTQWRVAYELLSAVIDGEAEQERAIEAIPYTRESE